MESDANRFDWITWKCSKKIFTIYWLQTSTYNWWPFSILIYTSNYDSKGPPLAISGQKTTTQWCLLHVQTGKRNYILFWAAGSRTVPCLSILVLFLSYLLYKHHRTSYSFNISVDRSAQKCNPLKNFLQIQYTIYGPIFIYTSFFHVLFYFTANVNTYLSN